MAVPAETPCPVTMPVEEPTIATAVLLLTHVPPEETSDKGIVVPEQTTFGPVIADGSGFTVMTAVAMQPVDRVYVDIHVLGIPTMPPVAIPEDEPIVAIAVLLLLQAPPVGASLNVIVDPEHTLFGPKIFPGNGLTVIVVVAIHPVVPSV